MRTRAILLLVALAPLAAVYACSGDDTTTADAGPDGSKPDATLDAAKDVANDTTTTDAASDAGTDAAADAAHDAGTDATADAAGDAGPDAAADAAGDGATDAAAADATTADATADATTADAMADATADATADAAADAGGSKWASPTCDGVVSASEYGGTSNTTLSGTQNWYMTWDATNLYVGLDTANTTEGAVLYVGFSGNGITAGQTYDVTNGTLPFKADAVIYAKDGYQEVRLADADASTWGAPAQSAITYCSNATTETREEVIPWTALGATSIPASFRFLAYATSSGGSVYGQIPTSNPSGTIGTNATFGHDFYVTSTADGTGSFPFDLTE